MHLHGKHLYSQNGVSHMHAVCTSTIGTVPLSICKIIQELLLTLKDPPAAPGCAQLVALLSITNVLGNMVLRRREQMVQGVLLETVLPGGKFMLYKCTSKLCYLI